MAKSRARVFADFVSGNNIPSLEYIASQANNLVLSIQEKLQVANAAQYLVSNSQFQSFVANTNQYINLVGGEQNVQLVQQGILNVTKGVARWYAPANVVVNKVTSYVSIAPQGNPLTIIINNDGVANSQMTIASNAYSFTNATPFNVEGGNYLTVDITTVGTITTGKDLNVQLFYSFN